MSLQSPSHRSKRPAFYIELFQAFVLGVLVMMFMKTVAQRNPIDLKTMFDSILFGILFSSGWGACGFFQAVTKAMNNRGS